MTGTVKPLPRVSRVQAGQNRVDQLFQLVRFAKVMVETGVDRPLTIVLRCMRRQGDGQRAVIERVTALADGLQDRKPVDSRHREIANEHVKTFRLHIEMASVPESAT